LAFFVPLLTVFGFLLLRGGVLVVGGSGPQWVVFRKSQGTKPNVDRPKSDTALSSTDATAQWTVASRLSDMNCRYFSSLSRFKAA
jgi:hypothetical protein